MAFMTVSDTTGDISLTLFPTVYRKYIQCVVQNKVLYVEGKTEVRQGQGLQILVSHLKEAAEIEEEKKVKKCFVRIEQQYEDGETLNRLKELFTEHSGSIPVILYYMRTNKKLGLQEAFWVNESSDLVKSVEELLGKGNIIID